MKYVHGGIIFKLATDLMVDDKIWMYGEKESNDNLAIKGAGAELKGNIAWSSISNEIEYNGKKLFLPLVK